MAEELSPATAAELSLRGARVMILRGGAWGERVSAQVRDRGGVPVVYPLIEVVYSNSPELQAAIERWKAGEYGWVVLTSANAVNAVLAVADSVAGAGSRSQSRIAVVGPGTAAAARSAGLSVDLMPEKDFSTDGLIAALDARLKADPGTDPVTEQSAGQIPNLDTEAQRILLPLSHLSDARLQTWLEAAGYLVDRVTAYRTVPVEHAPGSRTAFADAVTDSDVVLVTSGSAARALAANLSGIDTAVPPTIVAIGEPSAAALREVGLTAQAVAATQTIDGLLDAVAANR